MDRAQKEEQVAILNNIFRDAGVLVVTKNTGLSVAEATVLRRKMRDAGAHLKVAKNSLVKLAIKGTIYDQVSDLFVGPTAIAYSEEVVTAPRIVAGFAKTNEKLVIVGGAMGEVRLDAMGVQALADLPSLDELRAKLLGIVNAPAIQIASLMQATGGQIARVIAAYGSKQEAV